MAKYFHLAGIVPLTGEPPDLGTPWHPSLSPITSNLTLIQKAVAECAQVGCKTIWILCDDDITPMVRYMVGDWIEDPVWAHRPHSPSPFGDKREIPIFYIPTHPNDINRRDSVSWGILYGAQTADRVARQISKWVAPQTFYVSFPYGVYDFTSLRTERKDISSEKNFCVGYNNKTFMDGEYLAFTFNADRLKNLLKDFKENNTNMFQNGKRISPEDRYSGRFYSVPQAFKNTKISNYLCINTTFYHKIEDWTTYRNYISSRGCEVLGTSFKTILKYKEFNKIPKENINENN